jgi:hypothetical protein
MLMYGRLTFFEGTKGKEEAATRAFREQVVPLATRQPARRASFAG